MGQSDIGQVRKDIDYIIKENFGSINIYETFLVGSKRTKRKEKPAKA